MPDCAASLFRALRRRRIREVPAPLRVLAPLTREKRNRRGCGQKMRSGDGDESASPSHARTHATHARTHIRRHARTYAHTDTPAFINQQLSARRGARRSDAAPFRAGKDAPCICTASARRASPSLSVCVQAHVLVSNTGGSLPKVP